MGNLGSGNCLVDRHEADRAWHYAPEPVCVWCDDSGKISSVKEWIAAARECHCMETVPNSFRWALAQCHQILIEGSTDCPICR